MKNQQSISLLTADMSEFLHVNYLSEDFYFLTDKKKDPENQSLDDLGYKDQLVEYFKKEKKDKSDVFPSLIKDMLRMLEILLVFCQNKKLSSSSHIGHVITNEKMTGEAAKILCDEPFQGIQICGLVDLYEYV